MGDFTNFGGSDEENAEIKRLNAEIVSNLDLACSVRCDCAREEPPLTLHFLSQEADPDNFETWEKLIRACEGLDGGLNRNSSPQALAALRDSYDRFLLKFPLLFGYWKKYADLEFNISGPESAEMVRLPRLFLPGPAGIRLMHLSGVREGLRQHHQLGRPLDRVLLLQDGDHSHSPPCERVSGYGLFHSLPHNLFTRSNPRGRRPVACR